MMPRASRPWSHMKMMNVGIIGMDRPSSFARVRCRPEVSEGILLAIRGPTRAEARPPSLMVAHCGVSRGSRIGAIRWAEEGKRRGEGRGAP